MSGDVDRVAEVLARHWPGAYIATLDGHRECYCGHVLASDESYEAHVAKALLAPGGVVAGMVGEAVEPSGDYRVVRVTQVQRALDAAREAGAAEVLARYDAAVEETATWCGPWGYPGVAAFVDRRDAHIRNALADADVPRGGPETGRGGAGGALRVSVDPGDELGPQNGAQEVCGRCFIEKSANGTCGCEGSE
jgi:hypothetical protein